MLQAPDLIAALTYLHPNQQSPNLVFYLEACESGSMFNGLLPNNINIYATTASDPVTSSYACYYDEKRQTYLGDVYSVNWMENSDIADFKSETLDQQYQIVKKETNTSTVCEYGQLTLGTSALNLFQGNGNTQQLLEVPKSPSKADAVDSRDVPLAILKNRLAAASAADKPLIEQELNALLQRRAQIGGMFFAIAETVAGPASAGLHMNSKIAVTPVTLPCVEASTVAFHNQCVNLGQEDYGLQFTMSFVSMCQAGFTADAITKAISTVCAKNSGFVGGVN
jgi:legumain